MNIHKYKYSLVQQIYYIQNGFVVDRYSATGLDEAISHALECYEKPALWHQLQKSAMKGNFSWQASAEKYIELYKTLVAPG